MKAVKSKINQGSDILIPRHLWVSKEELQNTEEEVLKHPIIEMAFESILNHYKPKHSVALVSLCTATRPYSQSRKWKKFIQEFGNYADLIISSSGGVVPIEYDTCYPYLTYDVPAESQYDALYISVLQRRLSSFFDKFRYKYILFNYRPNLRNKIAAENFIKDYVYGSCVILPTEKAYNQARINGFSPGGDYYPDLSKECMNQLNKAIKFCIWNGVKNKCQKKVY